MNYSQNSLLEIFDSAKKSEHFYMSLSFGKSITEFCWMPNCHRWTWITNIDGQLKKVGSADTLTFVLTASGENFIYSDRFICKSGEGNLLLWVLAGGPYDEENTNDEWSWDDMLDSIVYEVGDPTSPDDMTDDIFDEEFLESTKVNNDNG